MIELGSLIIALEMGGSLFFVLAVAAAYQVGQLVAPFLSRLNRWASSILVVFGLVLIALIHRMPWLLVPATSMLTGGLQDVRTRLRPASVTTVEKRLARILGFLLAAVEARLVLLPVGIVVILATRVAQWFGSAKAPGLWKTTKLRLLMLVHQMHYFGYAYVLVYLLHEHFELGAAGIAFGFTVGWITYTASPVLLGRLPQRAVFIAGHVMNCGLILLLSLSDRSLAGFLLLWAATGIGGGTVFVLRNLAKRTESTPAFDHWENLGHVAGVGIAMVVSLRHSPWDAFLVASALALITALVMCVYSLRGVEKVV